MTDDFPILLDYFSSLSWWLSIYNSSRIQHTHTAHAQKSSCWNCVWRNYWCEWRTRNRNTSWKGLTACSDKCCCYSLVPRPPRFDHLFAFTTIRKVGGKLKLGRPGSIHHMNDIRWMRGGRRWGGAQLPEQCTGRSVWALYHIFRAPDHSVMESTRLDC